jgi:hypothetical protein
MEKGLDASIGSPGALCRGSGCPDDLQTLCDCLYRGFREWSEWGSRVTDYLCDLEARICELEKVEDKRPRSPCPQPPEPPF